MDSYKKPVKAYKYKDEAVKAIKTKLEAYINKADIPIVAEFAYLNNIGRQRLYEFPELKETLLRLNDKKEAQLERLGLAGKVDKTIAVFSLKQLGWKDTHTQDINVKEQTLKIEYI